ncbi:sulfurtransferase TusA [Candidatus Erwinia haradaeae]|uniref:Sulfur carrier protein TusA n=1 Tax=Candidatus Erwinia haradaeae TaxID=1922217 RepID=A0A451D7E9_9GAMM|nr:sulfurtransferase TusA [Candidatus Erwinia haradaeae]VFP81726.1 Sulfur carrier protein TusA [Candidatus Erwinia haradaeae]
MYNFYDSIQKTIDTQGFRCPEPIMMIRQAIRNIEDGKILFILSDDPSTTRDIPNFCHFMGHILIFKKTTDLPYQYLIKKGLA